MADKSITVAGMFRRAQEIKRGRAQMSYKDLKKQLISEYQGGAFPSVNTLTIPEQDELAPEEDWTAGLPLILRGIQRQDWGEIANGIALCLEQTENYASERGVAKVDNWHDRTIGIKEPLAKGVGKWMPQDLAKLAEKASKKRD